MTAVVYIAVVEGLSGVEFYLDARGGITEEKIRAARFASERAALDAAQKHIDGFEAVVRRGMKHRAEAA